MTAILENLFGSKERARLLRFFLQNPETSYAFSDIFRRNMLNGPKTKKEIENLAKMKFILKKSSKGKPVYQLNQSFEFYPELKSLVAKSNVSPHCMSLKKISKIGNIKLTLVSGVFINYHKSKADMIIVGEEVSKARLKNLMTSLEAEIGKEITFVLMNMEEFKYRLNMLDKFVLEFLEGPNEEIINKITGLKQFVAKRKL